MSGFNDIIGQDHIKVHFQKSIASGKVSHAYIISGEKDSGKELIANAFAMTLLCEKKGINPCMTCHSCKQYISNNHPDIKTLIPEKSTSTGVKEVREQIINDVGIRPYESPYKIYIATDIEKMTAQAQNALLKTLEEPPEYVVILLTTSNIDAVLDTIKSRSTILKMRPVKDEIIRKFLMEEVQIPDYQADICTAFARGNVGRARALASREDFWNLKKSVISTLLKIYECNTKELNRVIKEAAGNKEKADDYLDLMLIWYRDLLMAKASLPAKRLIFKDEVSGIRKICDMCTYEDLECAIKAIEEAKSRLKANVNYEMTLELMFMNIKERHK